MEKNYWKKVFTSSAIYFAVASAIIFLIQIVTSDHLYAAAFSATRMLFILGYCIVFSMANSFLSFDKIDGFWKLILHAVFTIGGFFALIYAPMNADNSYQLSLQDKQYVPSNIFVVIGLVIIVYAIGYGIYFIISSKVSKKKNAKEEYKSVYRNKK